MQVEFDDDEQDDDGHEQRSSKRTKLASGGRKKSGSKRARVGEKRELEQDEDESDEDKSGQDESEYDESEEGGLGAYWTFGQTESFVDVELVGQPVRKSFGALGVFDGVVVSVSKRRGLYRIVYQDGDREELVHSEVQAVLASEKGDSGRPSLPAAANERDDPSTRPSSKVTLAPHGAMGPPACVGRKVVAAKAAAATAITGGGGSGNDLNSGAGGARVGNNGDSQTGRPGAFGVPPTPINAAPQTPAQASVAAVPVAPVQHRQQEQQKQQRPRQQQQQQPNTTTMDRDVQGGAPVVLVSPLGLWQTSSRIESWDI